MKFTNTTPGPKGVNVIGGDVVFVGPGQTSDALNVSEAEAASAKATGWFEIDGKATVQAPAQPRQNAAKPDASVKGFTVTEGERGWCVITDETGAQVGKKLRSDEAAKFSALPYDEQVAYLSDEG